MHYQAPLFETQDVTMAAVRDGSASEVCQAVIGASLAADDAAWVETLCLDLARTHGDLRVQAAAILGLAHLARRFGL